MNYAHLVRRVLAYLVRLTEPVPAGDAAGLSAPGWWTNDIPSGPPDPALDAGHANLGMAHGISGPLALLALAIRRGVTVAGHAAGIDRSCQWLDTWLHEAPAGPWWPERDAHAWLSAAPRADLSAGPTSACSSAPRPRHSSPTRRPTGRENSRGRSPISTRAPPP